jgi:hypothetical protein
MRCAVRRRSVAVRGRNGCRGGGSTLVRFFNCTRERGTRDDGRDTWPVMRGGEIGSHRQRRMTHVWSVVASGGDGRWRRNLGQKTRKVLSISHVKGEGKWWGGAAASRWPASGDDSPQGGRKNGKRKNLRPGTPFIGKEETAWSWVHTSTTTSQRRGDRWSHGAELALLFPVGYARRGQCLNTDPGHCFTGLGPICYTNIFLIFKLAQICKIAKWPFPSSKILQTLHECSLTHDDLFFQKQVIKFKTQFELKI